MLRGCAATPLRQKKRKNNPECLLSKDYSTVLLVIIILTQHKVRRHCPSGTG